MLRKIEAVYISVVPESESELVVAGPARPYAQKRGSA
jgi:hypothetical protein